MINIIPLHSIIYHRTMILLLVNFATDVVIIPPTPIRSYAHTTAG